MDILTATLQWLADPMNWQGDNGILLRLQEHVALSGGSLLIAAAVAMPLGLFIGHTGRLSWLVVSSANAWRALPSFAVIGLLVPFTTIIDPDLGFTLYPTLVAMVVLAGPPLLVNSYQGIASVDHDLVEAARGMGMTERQILTGLEMPLALPVIGTGIRLAAVQVIATATLGSIFGFGGLGRYILLGEDNKNTGMEFGGVFLVAALALITFGLFTLIERRLVSPGLKAGFED